MSKRRAIHFPDGRVLTRAQVLRNYHDQVAGKGFSARQIVAGKRKVHQGFELMARAVWLNQRGHTPPEIDAILGLKQNRTKHWLFGGGYHKDASPPRFAYHKRTRRRVRPNHHNPYDEGYVRGLADAGRLGIRETSGSAYPKGKSRFVLRTEIPSLAVEAHRAIGSVFGIPPTMRTPRKSQMRSVGFTSANLMKSDKLAAELQRGARMSDRLPDDSSARLAYARAHFDSPRVRIKNKPHDKEVRLTHRDYKVLRVVSNALTEQGVRHTITQREGIRGINITTKNLPAFMDRIGFTDPKRTRRIS